MKTIIPKNSPTCPECHLLIAAIIKLRRDLNNTAAKKEFHSLIDNHLDVMIEQFTMRWLTSICNTIVDIDKKRAPTALNIVQAVNALFLHHRLLTKGRGGAGSMMHIRMSHTRGGIITCDIPNGDIITNMMVRLDEVILQDEQLNKIWCRIKDLTVNSQWDGKPASNGHYDDFNGSIVREMNK